MSSYQRLSFIEEASAPAYGEPIYPAPPLNFTMTSPINQLPTRGIFEIDGDLFNQVGYICHQCNCVSRTGKGLSYDIFRLYPEADIYREGLNRKPGDVIIRNNVINMIVQKHPSRPMGMDTLEARERAFLDCLITIQKLIPANSIISFPYNIGCGLGGGNWIHYRSMIYDFSSRNPNMTVYIVRKQDSSYF